MEHHYGFIIKFNNNIQLKLQEKIPRIVDFMDVQRFWSLFPIFTFADSRFLSFLLQGPDENFTTSFFVSLTTLQFASIFFLMIKIEGLQLTAPRFELRTPIEPDKNFR